ncbi:MAG: hypothetical protein ACKVU0_13925 [Saprospiraceae bacterium]
MENSAAIRFFEKHALEEFRLRTLLYRERNDSAFEAARDKFNTRYTEGLVTDIIRGPSKPLEYFEKADYYLNQLQPRQLLQVELMNHNKWRQVWRGIFSMEFVGDDEPFLALFAAEVSGQVKILSQYIICDICSGKEGGCDECGGLGWHWAGGYKFQTFGSAKSRTVLFSKT